MLPLRVFFALFPQRFVKRREIRNRRNRNEQIPPRIAHFILHVPFLVSLGGIAEIRLKPIVQFESRETVRQNPFLSFAHFRHSGREIVESNPDRNSSDTLKHPFQSFQKTLLILRRKNLRIPMIGIRKRHRQRVSFPLFSVRVMIQERPEIRLRPAFRRVHRQIFLRRNRQRTLLPPHIPLHAAIASRISFLIPQTLIDPFSRMPLFPRNLPIRFQPRVYRRNIRSQRRIALRIHIRLRRLFLIPVLFVRVLAHRLETQPRPAADFPQTDSFIFV